MNISQVRQLLLKHEGLRFTPYRCSAGKLTIGIGRNLEDKGITEQEALYLFENDIQECARDLANNVFHGLFFEFPDGIQTVLINMRFQLGAKGFRSFKKMIKAVLDRDYPEMINQMEDSKWYRQVPERAEGLIEIVRSV